jgi:hypothetical protein
MAAALEKLITDASRGDPMSPLVWTTHSAAHLAGELAAQGHPCSDSTVLRTRKRMGYTPQSNSRAQEGRRHPDRDGRFRRIAAAAREFPAAGQPAISVDAKKKDCRSGTSDSRPSCATMTSPGAANRTRSPTGSTTSGPMPGFVNVGTGGNTAALAIESIRRWHNMAGKVAYPGAGGREPLPHGPPGDQRIADEGHRAGT